MKSRCIWTRMEAWSDANWNSGCGEEFQHADADEPPRWMKFCPFCGDPTTMPKKPASETFVRPLPANNRSA